MNISKPFPSSVIYSPLILAWFLPCALFGVIGTDISLANEDSYKFTINQNPTSEVLSPWKFFGNTELIQPPQSSEKSVIFNWNTESANSALFIPIGYKINQQSDFKISTVFELTSLNIEFTPGSFYGFEIAFGLFDSSQVLKDTYIRGSGVDSPDLVEWDYFPDTGFGGTISPTIVDQDSDFFPTFNFPIELPIGKDIRVDLVFDSSDMILKSSLEFNESVIEMEPVKLSDQDTFDGFDLDSAGFVSYKDYDDNGVLTTEAKIKSFSLSWTPSPDAKPNPLPVSISTSDITIDPPSPQLDNMDIRVWVSHDLSHWELFQSMTINEDVGPIQIPINEISTEDNTFIYADFFVVE